jgi:hypothetical protein
MRQSIGERIAVLRHRGNASKSARSVMIASAFRGALLAVGSWVDLRLLWVVAFETVIQSYTAAPAMDASPANRHPT